MKAFKTGYVLVMVTFFILTVALGIAAFYPQPRRYEYPKYPALSNLDFNSSEYKTVQDQYQQDLKNYDEKNKDIENKRTVWNQQIFIIFLLTAVIFFSGSILLFKETPVLGIGLLFAALIAPLSGPNLASLYSESLSLPLVGGQSPAMDLTTYKIIQFLILLTGTIMGAIFGFSVLDKKRYENY